MDKKQPVQQASNQKPEALKAPRSLWWLAIVLFAAFGLSVWSWANKGETNATLQNANGANQNTNVPLTYMYSGQDGKTALELLKLAYPNTTTKTAASLGEYVTGIDGHEASSSQFWKFSVNGTESSVGAGSYVTKSADVIMWELTSF